MTFSEIRRVLHLQDAKHLLVFAAVLVVAAELSRSLSIDTVSMSILWPPTGMILGAAVIYGWPAVVISGPALWFWLFLLQDASFATAAAMTTSQLAGIAGGLLFLWRRGTKLNVAPSNVNDRVVYLKAGIISATISASLGTIAVWSATASSRGFSLHDMFLLYWLLEILSILLFGPLTFFVLQNPNRFLRNLRDDLRTPATASAILGIVSLSVIILIMPSSSADVYALALAFLAFPLLCWLVLASHPAVITTALPLVCLVFVTFLTLGLGAAPKITKIAEVVQFLLLLAGSVLLLQIISLVTFSRKELMATLKQQANTDFLSGLANDRAFLSVIGEQVEPLFSGDVDIKNQKATGWLVYLEVLDFDHLEDLMGFRARRSLETLFAARLMGVVGPECHPARLGNGIYAAICQAEDDAALDVFLDGLYQAFDGKQFSVEQHQTRIRVSIGAVVLDGSLADPNQYLSAATQAALIARDGLPRIHKINNPKSVADNRLGLTQRLELLKNALSNDRLVLFAQPIQPLSEQDSCLSYEILLRLRGDDGEFLSPGVFLPVAEAYGFMKQIDQWVIHSTLEALAANPDWLARTRKCSINLAGVSLSSNEVVEVIEKAFAKTGVPTHKIAFEVTETQQIVRREEAETITERLRAMGCSVSLDDFGTGLATFDYLKSFRFDTLKIDGVFIKNIETDANDKQIVKSICDVARWMGLKTVAEFVENHAVVDLLKELGVDYGQGFGLGKPAPLEHLFEEPTPR